MVYVPKISEYHPFYIQTAEDPSAIDTRVWGLVAKTNPYPVLPDTKDVYKNDWKDEDGDDEYVGSMRYGAITISVTFFIKAYGTDGEPARAVMIRQVEEFFSKIRSGYFSIYDSYTGIGRQKVRYVSYREDSFKSRENWARSIFTLTFKVNDPVTRLSLGTDGTLRKIM